VSVLNVVDGCMPSDLATGSDAEIEEERRLLYVAMTRARRHLALVVPQRFHVAQQGRHGDRHLHAGLTRFITPPMREHFEHLTEEPAVAERSAAAAPPVPTIDLWAAVRQDF
jgi:DNA helicase-2/ATP-dependent DNA helicase PcrA